MVDMSERGQTRTLIAVAVAIACTFIVLIVLSGFFSDYVITTRDTASLSHATSGLLFIEVVALAAWAISVDHRCTSDSMRFALMIIVVLLEFVLVAVCITSALIDTPSFPLAAITAAAVFGIAVIIEILLDTGILPSIRHYRSLFRNLPFDLKILNNVGRPIYQTNNSRPIDTTTLWRLASHMKAAPNASKAKTAQNTMMSIRTTSTPDRIFKLYRLNAGVALLSEDASEINRLQQQLELRQERLTNQNEVLIRNNAMNSLLIRQQRERELSERVGHDLASTAAQIRRILDNCIAGTGPERRAERLKQLNLVKVLVAYSKRKGMLALAAAESETLTSEQTEVVAREAMADLRSIGVECAMLVDSDAPISIAAFNTLYDSFYDCILAVLPSTRPVIMTYISMSDENTLELRATIECAIGLESQTAVEMIPQLATSFEPLTAVQMRIAHDLEGRLATRGGDYTVALEDDLINVTVRAAAPHPAADFAKNEPEQSDGGVVQVEGKGQR